MSPCHGMVDFKKIKNENEIKLIQVLTLYFTQIL